LLYAFEDYVLDARRRELRRSGTVVSVEPGVFDLLQFLVCNRDRVVTKDELLATIWRGRTVSESTISSRMNAARCAIGDSGEQQRLIRTFSRKGFRFVCAIRELNDPPGGDGESLGSANEKAFGSPHKPSIAVLAFTNMSGDPDQEYFSDGITEDIITELSRLRWFLVIARNSTFVYKGRAVDVSEIGRDLGARYILEGSVRKEGHRVRITSQLLDVGTRSHIWAERYDRELTDLFIVQQEIATCVTGAVEPKLLAAEGIRAQARAVESLNAWDLVAQALWHFWKLTGAECENAVALLRRAVERHPNYAPGHSMLAFALIYSAYVGWTPAGRDSELIVQLARRAVELDEDDPRAHLVLGHIAVLNRATEDALRHIRAALALNPNSATAYRVLAWALIMAGRADEGLRYCEQAIRIDPHVVTTGLLSVVMAGAHYQAGRYAEAVRYAKEAVERRPESSVGYRILCASLAEAGEVEEARSVMGKLQQLHPDISVSWIEQWVPYTVKPMQHFLNGLRTAGLPEK
jgi:TolB-like protein